MTLLTVLVAVTIATTITLAPLLVVLITGTLIPILTGLVTKSRATAGTKQAVTVVLAGAAGLVNSSVLADGTAVFSIETLILAAATWLTSIATYNGLYKAHSIDDRLAPNSGIGVLGKVVETSGFEKG